MVSRLQARKPEDRGTILGGGKSFAPHLCVQTGSGGKRVDTEGSPSGDKGPGRKVGHSRPPSAEVKNAWSYTSKFLWCFINNRDKLTRLFMHGSTSLC